MVQHIEGIIRWGVLNIAGVKANKSVVMVDDIAYLVPQVTQKGCVYNVCDDHNNSFDKLNATIAKQLGKHKWNCKLI